MNTPAHLLIGAAAFGRRPIPGTMLAASLGAIAPDLSLYLMAGVSLFVLGIEPRVVFNELYFSDAWQTVFAIDNSVFVWGAVLAVALWRRSDRLFAFAAAGLLHLICDFPLHHDDGRPHFWPISGWIFDSPFSYWDRGQGAGWIAPLELAIAFFAFVLLVRARLHLGWIALFALMAIAELWIVREWLFFFTDSV